MTHTLQIEIDRAEGSLQRLIGLIERRGFHIDRIAMDGDAGASRSVTLGVRARDAQRSPDVLGRQIDRLIGVRRQPSAPPFPDFGPEVVRCTP